MQVIEAFLNQRFCENVYALFCSINGMDEYSFILNKASKVVILDSNMCCPRSELGALCNLDTAFVIFLDFVIEDGLS